MPVSRADQAVTPHEIVLAVDRNGMRAEPIADGGPNSFNLVFGLFAVQLPQQR